MQRSHALEKNDLPFDRFLDRHLADELTDEARAYARMRAQGFDAADTRRASARAIVEEWTGGGSGEQPQFRPLGGYGRLLSALVSSLRGSAVELQLNTAIDRVSWKRGAVEVRGRFVDTPFVASCEARDRDFAAGRVAASAARTARRAFHPRSVGKTRSAQRPCAGARDQGRAALQDAFLGDSRIADCIAMSRSFTRAKRRSRRSGRRCPCAHRSWSRGPQDRRRCV